MSTEALAAAVERAVGSPPLRWRPTERGEVDVDRFHVVLQDGRRAFVKSAGDAMRQWLVVEQQVYEGVQATFLPEVVGTDATAERITIVLEDLHANHWPPPWTAADVAAAVRSLALVHDHRDVPRLPGPLCAGELPGWDLMKPRLNEVASVAGIGPHWLAATIDTLAERAGAASFEGTALVHGDAHGANFSRGADGRGVWVDWSSAHIGNPAEDDALLAISIAADGGTARPLSEETTNIAAAYAGSWAARVGTPPPEWGPTVRRMEQRLLVAALDLLRPVI